MATNTLIPKRDRPDIPKEYGVPATEKGLVEWTCVVDQLTKAKNYWLISQYPDGRPHCVPSWGAWVENKLYFSGGPMPRHAKNLAVMPGMIAHLESGDHVVIIYGKANNASNAPSAIMDQINRAYVEK